MSHIMISPEPVSETEVPLHCFFFFLLFFLVPVDATSVLAGFATPFSSAILGSASFLASAITGWPRRKPSANQLLGIEATAHVTTTTKEQDGGVGDFF